ncbi:response regulator transcription factor [Nocardioides sp. GY 10127]|uniref:response regulator transcription factor n=1 Tax=Nocardioides sp. GY 10127 TaxID=2569762 RepID=UPI0010A7C06E|nr:response regulator transcription factor [Nocardioides sp. GY 10127]TIC84462.1 response regulator transcription factor [Nocardioides sp. GY 10127]
MTSILLVEDDEAIRTAVTRGLRERGLAVASAPTGLAGLEHVLREHPDVVLLDLGLPDVDGLTLLSMIRAASQVPVIVLTAQDDDPTMVRALDGGADDYVVKPFGTDQVAARIRAVLRRGGGPSAPAAPAALRVGGLVIAEGARTVTLDGRPVELARKEFDVLLLLAQRRGQVVTKRELLAEVWQQAYGGSDRTVDVHLSWLRRKLGETAAEPRYLHSVRGVGVRLVDPADQVDRGDQGEEPTPEQEAGGDAG